MATMFDMLELNGLPINGDVLGVPGIGADVEFLLTETTADVPDDHYSSGLDEFIDAGFRVGSNGTWPAVIEGITYSTPRLWQISYDLGGTSYTGYIVEAVPVGGGAARYFFLPEDGVDASINSLTITSMTGVNFIDETEADSDDAITFVVCFAAGTEIDTPEGPRRVEDLRAGDLTMTLDQGALPVLWTSQNPKSAAEQRRQVGLRAVEIAPGALASGIPSRTLRVSRQHRLLVKSPVAERMFGHQEVLIAAKDLLGLPGVRMVPPEGEIDYVHLLLPCHSVLRAEGAWAESLWLGDEAVRMLGAETARQAAQMLYASQAPARPFVSGARARQLVTRHLRNGRPLWTEAGRAGAGRTDPSAQGLARAGHAGRHPCPCPAHAL